MAPPEDPSMFALARTRPRPLSTFVIAAAGLALGAAAAARAAGSVPGAKPAGNASAAPAPARPAGSAPAAPAPARDAAASTPPSWFPGGDEMYAPPYYDSF